jgi:hypothetical protein
MNKPIVSIPLSLIEIGLIIKVRKLDFGSIEIHKKSGGIERILVHKSEKITEETALGDIIQDLDVIKILKEKNIILKVGGKEE